MAAKVRAERVANETLEQALAAAKSALADIRSLVREKLYVCRTLFKIVPDPPTH